MKKYLPSECFWLSSLNSLQKSCCKDSNVSLSLELISLLNLFSQIEIFSVDIDVNTAEHNLIKFN